MGLSLPPGLAASHLAACLRALQLPAPRPTLLPPLHFFPPAVCGPPPRHRRRRHHRLPARGRHPRLRLRLDEDRQGRPVRWLGVCLLLGLACRRPCWPAPGRCFPAQPGIDVVRRPSSAERRLPRRRPAPTPPCASVPHPPCCPGRLFFLPAAASSSLRRSPRARRWRRCGWTRRCWVRWARCALGLLPAGLRCAAWQAVLQRHSCCCSTPALACCFNKPGCRACKQPARPPLPACSHCRLLHHPPAARRQA